MEQKVDFTTGSVGREHLKKKGAIDYVTRIDSKIILVDGNRVTELMIEHNVGVTSIAKYEIKKIDFDYFIED
ncbi:MAG: hypothetical protein QNJ53_06215 [Pleurocapsa sp. MO_192.B19]|nr:hypothetical protein [Pleurocapsa sp. MO_192.B19]